MCSTCAIPSAPSGPAIVETNSVPPRRRSGGRCSAPAATRRVGDVEAIALDHVEPAEDAGLASVRPSARVAVPLRVGRRAGDLEPVVVPRSLLVDERQVAAREPARPALVAQRVLHRIDPERRLPGRGRAGPRSRARCRRAPRGSGRTRPHRRIRTAPRAAARAGRATPSRGRRAGRTAPSSSESPTSGRGRRTSCRPASRSPSIVSSPFARDDLRVAEHVVEDAPVPHLLVAGLEEGGRAAAQADVERETELRDRRAGRAARCIGSTMSSRNGPTARSLVARPQSPREADVALLAGDDRARVAVHHVRVRVQPEPHEDVEPGAVEREVVAVVEVGVGGRRDVDRGERLVEREVVEGVQLH